MGIDSTNAGVFVRLLATLVCNFHIFLTVRQKNDCGSLKIGSRFINYNL